MLNVMIVDDEPPARARLGQVLLDCSNQVSLQLVGEAGGGIRGLEEVDRLNPDVVLLDVHMPDMNGIEMARHLAQRSNPPAVIFVTAYDEHALEAFEVRALDYLMKPVRAERLVAALARAERFRTHEPRIEDLAKTIGAVRSHITVSERGRMILVPVEEIVYLRAELKYVTIRTSEREHLTEESLTSLEAEFGERFVRIHRNALVARKSILGFQRVRGSVDDEGEASEGHWEVLLKDVSDRLPISRRQWPTVKAAAKTLTPLTYATLRVARELAADTVLAAREPLKTSQSAALRSGRALRRSQRRALYPATHLAVPGLPFPPRRARRAQGGVHDPSRAARGPG